MTYIFTGFTIAATLFALWCTPSLPWRPVWAAVIAGALIALNIG